MLVAADMPDMMLILPRSVLHASVRCASANANACHAAAKMKGGCHTSGTADTAQEWHA